MLKTLEGQNGYELHCGSHVDRLLSKMAPTYCDSFVEHCLRYGILQTGTDRTYTLQDLATWLQTKSQAKRISSRAAVLYQTKTPQPARKDQRIAQPKEKPTVCFNITEKVNREETTGTEPTQARAKSKPKPYCPYCDSRDHYLNSCEEFKKLNTDQVLKWLKDGKQCRKCGRDHTEDQCTLKRPCPVKKRTSLSCTSQSRKPNRRCTRSVYFPQRCIWTGPTDLKG